MPAEQQLTALGITLAVPGKPAGVYKPVVQVGNLLYLSGHGPIQADGKGLCGKVGADLTMEQTEAVYEAVGLSYNDKFRGLFDQLVASDIETAADPRDHELACDNNHYDNGYYAVEQIE